MFFSFTIIPVEEDMQGISEAKCDGFKGQILIEAQVFL